MSFLVEWDMLIFDFYLVVCGCVNVVNGELVVCEVL